MCCQCSTGLQLMVPYIFQLWFCICVYHISCYCICVLVVIWTGSSWWSRISNSDVFPVNSTTCAVSCSLLLASASSLSGGDHSSSRHCFQVLFEQCSAVRLRSFLIIFFISLFNMPNYRSLIMDLPKKPLDPISRSAELFSTWQSGMNQLLSTGTWIIMVVSWTCMDNLNKTCDMSHVILVSAWLSLIKWRISKRLPLWGLFF